MNDTGLLEILWATSLTVSSMCSLAVLCRPPKGLCRTACIVQIIQSIWCKSLPDLTVKLFLGFFAVNLAGFGNFLKEGHGLETRICRCIRCLFRTFMEYWIFAQNHSDANTSRKTYVDWLAAGIRKVCQMKNSEDFKGKNLGWPRTTVKLRERSCALARTTPG